jgi:hypothetical protein
MSSANDPTFSSDSDTYVGSSPSPSPSNSVIKLPPAESDSAIDNIDALDLPQFDYLPTTGVGVYLTDASAPDPRVTSVSQSTPLGLVIQEATDGSDKGYWPDVVSSSVTTWYSGALFPSNDNYPAVPSNDVFLRYGTELAEFGGFNNVNLESTIHVPSSLGVEDSSASSFPSSMEHGWSQSTSFPSDSFHYLP